MNDTKLIQLIQENDEEAIELLMIKYSKLLWKVADGVLNQIGSTEDTEEVVADVFISIWQKPELFSESRSTLKNYLCLICKSKAIDKFRVLTRNAAADIDNLALSSKLELEDSLIRKEKLNLVYDAIASLPEEEQGIIIRRFIYDQKPQSIAKATGMNIRQIENIIYRSKIKIRDFINQRG